jgi:Spy/CpxP family protein refolding chaperone
MLRASVFAFLFGSLLVLSADGLVAQEAKKEDPKAKKEDPKETKKDEPVGKFGGKLPANYKKLGLNDSQTHQIYKIQGKYNEEIDKLNARVKELRETRDKEVRAVLTPDQKKRLEEIVTGKDKDK